jgi:hypothetical protein
MYCSMNCYAASGLRAEIARRTLAHAVSIGAAPARDRPQVACAHCGEKREVKRSGIGRYWNFCNRVCQRAFYSARFDAFIGNPETIALPQNYDEFLDRTELRCPVDHCDWTGKGLSYHARLVHGIAADRFKMMLGFNLGTGLISKDLAAIFSDRMRSAPDELKEARIAAMLFAPRVEPRSYVSAERIEHWRKSIALTPRIYRPCSERTKEKIRATKSLRRRPIEAIACKGCGTMFRPKIRRGVCCSRRCTGLTSARLRAELRHRRD